jgi:hypothetical protein
MNTTFPQKRPWRLLKLDSALDDLAGLRIAQQAALSGSPLTRTKKAQAFGH